MEKTMVELRSIPEERVQEVLQKVAEALGKVCTLARRVF